MGLERALSQGLAKSLARALALGAEGGDSGGGGGGGDLALPVVLDFKNGTYAANGASVTLDALLVEDTNFGNWDPANISAGVGLVGNSTASPEATTALSALVVSGATYIVEFDITSGLPAEVIGLQLFDAGYNDFEEGAVGVGSHACKLYGADTTSNNWNAGLALGAHKVALTVGPTHLAGSVDGGSVGTLDPAAPGNAPTLMGLSVNAGVTVTKLTISALAPDDDLQAWSTP